MKSKLVHIVYACTSYEGEHVVRIFEDLGDACDFKDKCMEWHSKRPKCPDTIENTPEKDLLYSKFCNKDTNWRKRHPGGKSSSFCEWFEVRGGYMVPRKPPRRRLKI